MTVQYKILRRAGAALLLTATFNVSAGAASFPGLTYVSDTAPEVAISLHHGAWHIYLNGDYSKDAATIRIEDTKDSREYSEPGEPGYPLLITHLEHADQFGLPPIFAIEKLTTSVILCKGCSNSRQKWTLHKVK